MEVISSLSAISEENAASTQETNAGMEELDAQLTVLAQQSKDLLETVYSLCSKPQLEEIKKMQSSNGS